MQQQELSGIIKLAPQAPGVYFFKNERGRVIYIGKAANLRARLRSYAQGGWKDDMVRAAANVEWKELSSDIEALITESSFIKSHKPKYNLVMRDDKNYFFVAFSHDTFPRIYLTHQPGTGAQTRAIGPFTDGAAIKRVIMLLRRAFPYCTCPPKPKHKRKCVNAQIGKCLGFCCADMPVSPANKKQYMANMTSIRKVLTGKTKTLARELAARMERAAHARHYEEAQALRDQVASLARIFEHQPYLQNDLQAERERAQRLLAELLGLERSPERIECFDISHHQGSSSVASMAVFVGGMPAKDQYRKFIVKTVKGVDDFASLYEVVGRRLRRDDWPRPDLIIIDGGKGQLSAVAKLAEKENIPIASIAKREEELYVPGRRAPFPLKTLPQPLFNLITALRDEAHRFAISFHRRRQRRLVVRG
ncbi:MAG: GIY-YIG nuclease family protein [Patescibacteria group bacterium]